MYKDSLEPLFNSPVLGYAHHRIILDEAGKPVDYEFLEVNPAFEKFTGLKKEELLNRTVREVLPGIEKGKFDWIGYYGEIALGGSEKHFEQFSEPLQKWYRVHAYSTGHMYFSALCLDITSDDLIAEASKKFNEYHSGNVDYDDIARQMQLVSGAKYVALNVFDQNRDFTTMGFAGISPHLKKASSLLGFNISGKKWIHDPVREEKIKDQKTTFFENLSALTGETLPRGPIEAIEKMGNTGVVVIIKTTKDHLPLGDFTLIFEKGSGLQNQRAAETLADVTGLLIDRINTEQKALESKDQFESLVTNIPGITFRCKNDADWTMIYMTSNVDAISGYAAEELLHNRSVSYGQLIVPEDRAMVSDLIASAIEENRPWEIEYRIRRKDGRIRWAYEKGRAVFDQEGEIAFLDGFILDITDKKQAEQALDRERRVLRTLIDTLPDSIYVKDSDGRKTLVNRANYVNAGFDRQEDVIGKSDFDIYPAEIARSFFEDDQRVLKHGESVVNREEKMIKPDGEVKHQLTTKIPLYDQKGVITGMVGIGRDITERKKDEDRMRFLSMIPKNMFDSVIATDRSFRITYVNKRAEQLFGYSSDELAGQTPDMFNAEPLADEIQKKLYETVSAGKTYTGESLNRRKDGSLFICDYGVSPLFDETGKITGYLGVQRDITRQRETEKALLESNKQLDLFFSQSFSGFFFMMLDEPVAWNDEADKEALLDYIMTHQRMTKVNQAMLDQYGAREEDLFGLTPNDLFAHDLEHGRHIWKGLFDKGRWHVETREQKRDGTPMIIDGDYICLYDEQGRVTGHFGVQKEVTEQKKARQKLEESEKKFADAFNLLRGVLESSRDMVVFALDRHYRYLAFNTNHEITMKQIWGADIAVGNSMLAYIRDSADREKAKANFDRALAGEAFTITEQYGDIARRWYENIYNPLYDAKGDLIGLTLFLSDITKRKRAEEEIKKQLSEKELILKEVNHRIKNNFGTVESLLQLQTQSKDNPETQSALQDAVARVQSMRVLYDQLLISEEQEELSVKDYVENLADSIVASFPDSDRITIEKKIADFSLASNRLFNVGIMINELLTNAMKYAFRGKETGKLMVSVGKVDKQVTLTVQDDGNGLPEGFDASQSQGFGLTLVTMLSQQLNGHFSMENANGTRCRIEFEL